MKEKGIDPEELYASLDLVALATIADVVPLNQENRTLVRYGLKALAQTKLPGLRALMVRAGLRDGPIDAGQVAFRIAPRINAAGRMAEAMTALELLMSDDVAHTSALADRLEDANDLRREEEARMLEEALEQLEGSFDPARNFGVVLEGEGWHPGVIGIVAGRLKERYALPSLVLAVDPDAGEARGSGRSVPGVDLGNAVIAARQEGLLVGGGGHPMAAGLTVKTDRIGDLRAFLEVRLRARLEAIRYRPALGLDGALQPAAANADLVRQLERCGPFGSGFAQPRFALPAARVVRADVVGKGHLRCILSGPDGGRLKGIAFGAMENGLGAALRQRAGAAVHLAGKLRPDRWAGPEAVQFIIEDAAAVAG
ncbi:MAG: hypothetical protein IID48_12265 [Proteobacteria bacterium]|nr:hypothetical protein [Pseudomonadota bacterium]